MSRHASHPRDSSANRLHQAPPPDSAAPAATQPWITPALIQQTLDCWQSHFAKTLTTADAVEILTNVGQLFDALK